MPDLVELETPLLGDASAVSWPRGRRHRPWWPRPLLYPEALSHWSIGQHNYLGSFKSTAAKFGSEAEEAYRGGSSCRR